MLCHADILIGWLSEIRASSKWQWRSIEAHTSDHHLPGLNQMLLFLLDWDGLLIGAQRTDDVYIWKESQDTAYFNQSSVKYPLNGHEEDCLLLLKNGSFQAVSCDEKVKYICQSGRTLIV